MIGLGIRPSAVDAWRELLSALLDLTTPTVCASDAESFTDPAPEDVAYLATLCTGCPVFALCNTFANVNRERDGGIWAGKHRQPKRGRSAAQPSKETTCNAQHGRVIEAEPESVSQSNGPRPADAVGCGDAASHRKE